MTEAEMTQDFDSQDINKVRAWGKRQEATAKSYREQLVGLQLAQIGLQPDAGLGKAIVKEFREEVTPDAVATYAKDEYGYVYTPPPPAQDSDSVEEPAAQELANAESEFTAVTEAASSAPAGSLVDELEAFNKRVVEGAATPEDASRSISAKVAQL